MSAFKEIKKLIIANDDEAVIKFLSEIDEESIDRFEYKKITFWAISNGHLKLLKQLREVMQKYISYEFKEWLILAARCDQLEILEELLIGKDIEYEDDSQINTALYGAASHGNLKILKRFLQIPSFLENVAANYNEIFERAQRNNNLNVVEYLLQIPAVRDACNGHPCNAIIALRLAARNGNLKLVELLLQLPIHDIHESAAQNGFVGLELAAENGHFEVVDRLLQIPGINAAYNNNEALYLAQKNGHSKIAERLLKVPEVQATPYDAVGLRFAAQKGDFELVKRLLENPEVRHNAAAYENEALRWAAENEHFEIVELLLQIPEVENIAYQTLSWALKNGYLELASRLLQIPEVQENAMYPDNDPLRIAAENGYLEIVECLLKLPNVQERVVNWHGNSILISTANKGNSEILNLLMKLPNFQTVQNTIFLQWELAARSGNLEMLQSLLQTSEIKNHIAECGNTALELAAENGHLEMVKRLLLIPEVTDYINALVYAAEKGHLEVVKYFLQISDFQNYSDKDYNDILVGAAKNGHLEVVKCLLQRPEFENNASFEALDIAAARGYTEIVKLLLPIDPITNNTYFFRDITLHLLIAVHTENVVALDKLLERIPYKTEDLILALKFSIDKKPAISEAILNILASKKFYKDDLESIKIILRSLLQDNFDLYVEKFKKYISKLSESVQDEKIYENLLCKLNSKIQKGREITIDDIVDVVLIDPTLRSNYEMTLDTILNTEIMESMGSDSIDYFMLRSTLVINRV